MLILSSNYFLLQLTPEILNKNERKMKIIRSQSFKAVKILEVITCMLYFSMLATGRYNQNEMM